MSSVKKRFGVQVIVSNGEVAIQLALSMVLARLLSPEDIGVYSMSAVLVGVAHIFRDFGVSSFIKRQKELDPDTLKAALGVVMSTSWLVALLMFFSAPLWASFFGEPRVEKVVRVLALGFVLIPFGALPGAILVRNLDVRQTSKATAIALTVYVSVSIGLALKGFGYMTMAWASVINIAVHVTALRLLSRTPTPWLPGFRGWKRVANFGVGAITTSAMTAIDAALPDILLGRMSQASTVGFFSKSNSTVNIASSAVMPAVNYFALPYLARLHHANANIAAEVCRATSYLASLLLPAMAMTALLAHEIISVLYGPKWLPSVEAVGWLCISSGIAVLFSFSLPALTGIGKPYVAGLPLAVLLVLKVVLALWLFDGTLTRFAQALVLAQLLVLPIYLWVMARYLQVTLGLWLRTVIPVVVLALLLGGLMAAVRHYLPPLPNLLVLLIMGGLAAPVWLALLVALRLPLVEELAGVWARLRRTSS